MLYIPFEKVLVISGEDIEINLPERSGISSTVSDTFIYHLTSNTIQRMPNIRHSRTSFAAHYDFLDQFVYVIGGNNSNG